MVKSSFHACCHRYKSTTQSLDSRNGVFAAFITRFIAMYFRGGLGDSCGVTCHPKWWDRIGNTYKHVLKSPTLSCEEAGRYCSNFPGLLYWKFVFCWVSNWIIPVIHPDLRRLPEVLYPFMEVFSILHSE